MHCIRTIAVNSHFQMQMVARDSPGMPDISDNLSRLHLLTGGDADGRTVGVQCFQPSTVVDLDVVAVTAAPTVKAVGNGDDAVCGGEDRRTLPGTLRLLILSKNLCNRLLHKFLGAIILYCLIKSLIVSNAVGMRRLAKRTAGHGMFLFIK